MVSLLINSFNLSIILRLEALKGTKYRCVPINIALTDIVTTIVLAILYTCHDFFMFHYAQGEPELRIPIMVMILASSYISFHVFLVASVEKYLAICKPFSYQSSVLVRWLPLNFIIVWLYILSLGTVVSLIIVLDLIPGMSYLGITLSWTAVFAVALNLVSGTLLIKVYRELKRMRNRSENSARDSEQTNAAMYLIIIFTLEMIVFLLHCIGVIVLNMTGKSVICDIWAGFIKAPYTGHLRVEKSVLPAVRTQTLQM